MYIETIITKITAFFSEQIVQSVLLIFFSFLIAAFLSRTIRLFLKNFFEKSSAYLKVEPTNYKFFLNGATLLIFLIAAMITFNFIPTLKGLSLPIFGGAGIFAAIVGFASRQVFANMISGVFIVIYKPFRVGDHIKIGEDRTGVVDDITLRHTVIRNFENRHIIIPNSIISSETIINSSIIDRKLCIHVEFHISYDTTIDTAISVIQNEAVKHPQVLDIRSVEERLDDIPQVVVRVIDLLEYSVHLRAYVWARDPSTAFTVKCDLLKSIKERFDREGIEIPFPTRTVVFKKPVKRKRGGLFAKKSKKT